MKRLFLLAGLPGVGKSTVSRSLSNKLEAIIVDIDDFKKIVVDPTTVTKEIDPPELRWLYYQEAIQHVLGLYDQGVSAVIMDEVFHLSSLRSSLEILCIQHDVEVQWVEVRCSYDTVAKRLRSTGRNGHILSTEEALAMHLRFTAIFEPFARDSKNHIVIDNEDDVSVDLLVERVLQKI